MFIFPDVRLSPSDRDAVKFTVINIRLELTPEASEELKASFKKIEQKLLNDVIVEMTSSGNYFYRYNRLYYNLPSSQL